jgi:serine/threonine protein kinase
VPEAELERFGPFVLLSSLGRAGLGQVWVARPIAANFLLRLKIFDDAGLRIASFGETALRAAKLLRQLEHPHLVKSYDFGVVDGQPYAAIELVRGIDAATLAAHARRSQITMPTAIASRVLLDLLAAINALHARGIIHGHIGQRDAFVGLEGITKLADFGVLSLMLGDGVSDPKLLVEYPKELAPEISIGQQPTAATDVYGIARLVSTISSGPIPGLDGLLARWMQIDPSRRPQSVDAARAELVRFAEEGSPIANASDVAVWIRRDCAAERSRIVGLFDQWRRGESGPDRGILESGDAGEASTIAEPETDFELPRPPTTEPPTVRARAHKTELARSPITIELPMVPVQAPLWDLPAAPTVAPRDVNRQTAVLEEQSLLDLGDGESKWARLSSGHRFGRFVIEGKIADGGMAYVYKARRDGDDRPCVLKLVMPVYASNPDYTRMFADEARISKQLHHPNIVTCLESGEVEGTPYIAFELIEGLDLHTLSARIAPERLPIAVAIGLGVEIARALHYAHRLTDSDGKLLELVHRDVSPQNVLISKTAEVKLLDFGISRFRDRLFETRVGVIKGKLSYMSPEQLEGRAIDARTDIYQLGLVLIEALTGESLPISLVASASQRELVQQMIQRQLAGVPEIPADLAQLLTKMSAQDPAERPSSAAEVAAEMLKLLARFEGETLLGLLARAKVGRNDVTLPPTSTQGEWKPDTVDSPPPGGSEFRLWWIWLLILACAVGVGLGWYLVH